MVFTPSNEENIGNEFEQKDNWERFNYCGIEQPAIGRYRIIYEDQNGLKTERDIVVKRAHESIDGKYAIDAHCQLRNAHRTFINDRIRNAVNLDSGEIVEDLAINAMAQYDASDEGRVWAAINKEGVGVAILLFVCRADGQMRKAERVIVAEYINKYCADTSLDESILDSSIKSLLEPDQKIFKRLVRDLKNDGDQERLINLLDCAKRIVATQKKVDPIEKAAIEIIQKAIT